LLAQIERHQPSLLDHDPAGVAPTIEMPALTRLSRFSLAGRLRRLRRAA
jgi:hypothetical protein